MITVASVWVRGQVPFTVDYVVKLRNMVRRHLPIPHRFLCLTDRPAALPAGIQAVRIETPPRKGWWAKVELFNPAHGFSGRMLYLDLDTLVVGDLVPVATFPAPFVLVPPGGCFAGAEGLATVRRYNSSVMAWDAGSFHRLYSEWTVCVADRLWGDQDWIGEQMPDAATFPEGWCPRLSEVTGPPFGVAKIVLAKVPKNHDASGRWPWFAERWQ